MDTITRTISVLLKNYNILGKYVKIGSTKELIPNWFYTFLFDFNGATFYDNKPVFATIQFNA